MTLLIKFLIVGQERESTLEDLAHASQVEIRSSGQKPPQSNQKTQQKPRNTLSGRLCETCGKPHSGVYYRAIGAHFNYGETSHFAKDCINPCRSG